MTNLLTLLLTAFSWFVLGIFCGFGYCPCTEWHWQVRMKLGYFDMSQSYIHFLIKSLTGFNVNPKLLDIAVVFLLFFAIFASILTNMRDRKRWKYKKSLSV